VRDGLAAERPPLPLSAWTGTCGSMSASAAKRRKLRAKVLITEESLSSDSEPELEIAGAVETAFVPAWARAAPAESPPAPAPQQKQKPPPQQQEQKQEPPSQQKQQKQKEMKKKKKQQEQPEPPPPAKKKKPKLTKEQRAAAGPPAWKQDCATCPSCVIRPVPGKGRGLVCTRAVKAGEVVVGELPAVHWVYASWRASACAWCMKLANNTSVERPHTLRCEDCAAVSWCSEACAEAHRAQGDHGVACSFLSTVGAETLQDDDASAVLSLACGVLALRATGQEKAERLVLTQSTEVALNASERRAATTVADMLLSYAPSSSSSSDGSPSEEPAAKFSRAILDVAKEATESQQQQQEEESEDEEEDDSGSGGGASGLAWWLRQMVRREKSNSFGHHMVKKRAF
jgi:hypothetical protein